MDAPNLDCMTYEDIRNLGLRTPRKLALELWPDRPAGHMHAARGLILYAREKAFAMRLRASGKMQHALTCERLCECIYRALPDFARW